MGLAAARLFHAEGANVVLAGRSDASVRVAEELGDRAIAMRADVSQAGHVQALVGLAVSRFNGLDILCNVAGASGSMVSFTESSEENFDEMVNVNLRAVYLTMKFAIPQMLKGKGGAIVNVSSAAALIGTPSLGAYGAAKGGVVAADQDRRARVRKGRHSCQLDLPWSHRHTDVAQGLGAEPDAHAYFENSVPMGRIGKPEEVAAAMLFLASPEASYITGVTLPVEGGQTAA